MQTECVLLQIGEDAEIGMLIPYYDAEHLGSVIASATVVDITNPNKPRIVDAPVILKSFSYAVEQDD